VIYQRSDRRGRRVLRLFQPLLGVSDASAFSAHSAVKLEESYSDFTEKFDSAVRKEKK